MGSELKNPHSREYTVRTLYNVHCTTSLFKEESPDAPGSDFLKRSDAEKRYRTYRWETVKQIKLEVSKLNVRETE